MRTRGDWKFVALFAVMALLFGLAWSPASAATVNVGQHIHDTILNDPVKGQVIPRAKYTFRHEIRLHDMPAKATSIRVSDYSTVKVTKSISLGPCSDCLLTVAFEVDFSTWSCGEHELRWTVNVPSQTGSQRHYTTSRSFVTLAGCTTPRHDRTGWFGGGGNWYDSYQIAVLGTPEAQVKAGSSIKVRAQSSATGGCLFVNPDFHAGSRGTQVGSCWSGTSWVTRTMPAGLSTGDRVVILSRDSDGAGLYGFKVGDAADGFAWHDQQAWWAKGGLVLP
jgi:hypothetical protein